MSAPAGRPRVGRRDRTSRDELVCRSLVTEHIRDKDGAVEDEPF